MRRPDNLVFSPAKRNQNETPNCNEKKLTHESQETGDELCDSSLKGLANLRHSPPQAET